MLCVSITAKPKKCHPEFWEIGGASCSIFINSDNRNDAIFKATDYLSRFHWDVESLNEVSVVNNPQHFDHDEELLELYLVAKKFGVSALIVACPTGGEIEDNPPNPD